MQAIILFILLIRNILKLKEFFKKFINVKDAQILILLVLIFSTGLKFLIKMSKLAFNISIRDLGFGLGIGH